MSNLKKCSGPAHMQNTPFVRFRPFVREDPLSLSLALSLSAFEFLEVFSTSVQSQNLWALRICRHSNTRNSLIPSLFPLLHPKNSAIFAFCSYPFAAFSCFSFMSFPPIFFSLSCLSDFRIKDKSLYFYLCRMG